MEFQEKYKLIEQTVQYYIDKFGMFTAEDLISEAWLNKQVREADKPKRVVKATKDACVNFLRQWNKFSRTGTKTEAKIIHAGTMIGDKMNNVCQYEEDNTTELLKEDLYEQMSEEERKIVEYRTQGLTYKEIAAEMYYRKVMKINKKMQKRMCEIREQLLGD